MQEPLISVIVPIYNTEKYLKNCIESIINQTYCHLEIILVDDGSTDSSLEICKEYQKKDSRIQVLSQTNQGLICARKAGLLIAKADFIGFVDSDDWIEANMYEEIMKIYDRSKAELISTGIFRDDIHGRKEVCDNYREGLYYELDREIYPSMLWNNEKKDFGLYCTLVNKLFLRKILLKVYDNINTEVFYGEDCLAIYQYCLLVKSIYIHKKAYYHYNIYNSSMCRRSDERLPSNTYQLYKGLKNVFMNYYQPYILLRQLKKYILNVEIHNLEILYDIKLDGLGRWKFQYEELYNKKFVIYGAGACGQALYHQIYFSGKSSQIIAWVDKEFAKKEKECLYHIDAPIVLTNLEYDYIIIAVKDERVAKQIEKELIEIWKIDRKKIIWKEVEYLSIFDVIF